MTKLTLTTVGSTLTNTAATQINANNAAIVAAVENTLSRDGSIPNQMNADIDMNGNDLLNVSRANVESLFIDGEGVQSVDLATALKISNNLSDVQSVTAARSNLGLTDTATSPSSAFGKNLIDDASALDARATLGVVIGTDVQAFDAALQSISGLTTAANQMIYTTALDTYTTTSLTSYGRTLIDDIDAATARTTLGLGTVATQNTGTSGATIPFLNGANTWSATQTYGTIVLGGGVVAGSAASPTLDFGGSIGIYRTSTALRMTYSGVVIGEFSASGLVMANNQPISFAGTGAATTRTNLGLGTAAVLNALVGTATYDPPSLVDGAGASTTVTVTGAALGDVALASFSLSTQGITVTANVTAADTVTVRFQNETTGTIDLASGTLKAVVLK